MIEEFETYEGKCFSCKNGIVGFGVFCRIKNTVNDGKDSCEKFEKEA